jgi:hypothetical protein
MIRRRLRNGFSIVKREDQKEDQQMSDAQQQQNGKELQDNSFVREMRHLR